MNLFYTTNIQDGIACLPEEEARHCMQVLRHKEGDEITFADGKGNWYTGIILEGSKKSCLLSIRQRKELTHVLPCKLHIAIAPTKNINRIEWFLEKATEIGIHRISLIISEHSERRKVRIDRLEKVILTAMKQSLKAHLPTLDKDLVPFKTFIQQEQSGQKMIAYLGEGVNSTLKENYQVGDDVCIMVGPEGGFSAREAEAAIAAGFLPVSLGKSRLRTETAGVTACHTINLINQ